MRVYGITGWKNTGKTTLTERLIAEMVARGLAECEAEVSLARARRRATGRDPRSSGPAGRP